MLNTYKVDKNREYQKLVHQVLAAGEKDSGKGGQTLRVMFEDYVIKMAKSSKGYFSIDRSLENLKLLDKCDATFPETILGRYDLTKFGMEGEKPLIIQRRADETFHQTFSSGEPSQETYKLLEGAVELVDRAAMSNLELDTSLSNFGFFDDGKNVKVAYLDVQDKHSVKQGIDEIYGMYESLITSVGRGNKKRTKKAEEIVERVSKNAKVT